MERESFWHGQGTLTLVHGSYAGEFDRDKMMHGQGTFTFLDGDKWFGQWKNGKPDGQGTWTYKDGRVEKGVVKKDKLIQLASIAKPQWPSTVDFGCLNICKDAVKGMTIGELNSFCMMRCSLN